jgi:hypothetical protein
MDDSKAARRAGEIVVKLREMGLTRDEISVHLAVANQRRADTRPERVIEDLHSDVLGVIANAEARGRAAERAFIAADLRVWAEQGGDPWMVHVADEVAAGRRPEPSSGT